ncbi:hypothetical protein ElyMa_006554100 [Elysia marginata]|uniref:Uncharacterized protein n=1 Tax=Elysia marginata TaxID=1093978 RepID=A0AAV4I976_9GAST|nr:hypothetical protein ElyMa_006554100 [Elysia marginata]
MSNKVSTHARLSQLARLSGVYARPCRSDNPAQSVSERLGDIQAAIKQSSKESLGLVTTTKQRKHPDPEISVLSKEQKEIRIKIQNTKDDNETRARLKIERNKYYTPSEKDK